MDRIVEELVKSCDACLICTTESKREPLKMSLLPDGPWKEVSIDFAELSRKKGYLLIVIDDYSRCPVVDVVKSTSTSSVIPDLDKVFSEFGIPDVAKTDNGPPFNSLDFQSFSQDLGFKHRKITPRWPQANGEVERFVRTVKKVIKTATVERKNWKQEMHRFLRNYRATPHSTTRVPEITKKHPDESIREQDRVAKVR